MFDQEVLDRRRLKEDDMFGRRKVEEGRGGDVVGRGVGGIVSGVHGKVGER